MTLILIKVTISLLMVLIPIGLYDHLVGDKRAAWLVDFLLKLGACSWALSVISYIWFGV